MPALPEAAQSPPAVRPSVPPVYIHHYNIEYRALFDLSGASFSFSWSRVRSETWRRWGTRFRTPLLLFPIHFWKWLRGVWFRHFVSLMSDVCIIHSADRCFDHVTTKNIKWWISVSILVSQSHRETLARKVICLRTHPLRLPLSPAASWRSLDKDYPARNRRRNLDSLEHWTHLRILLRWRRIKL